MQRLLLQQATTASMESHCLAAATATIPFTLTFSLHVQLLDFYFVVRIKITTTTSSNPEKIKKIKYKITHQKPETENNKEKHIANCVHLIGLRVEKGSSNGSIRK